MEDELVLYLSTTTKRFSSILDAGFLPQHGAGLFTSVNLDCSDKGIINNQSRCCQFCHHKDILIVHNTYKPEYFYNYLSNDRNLVRFQKEVIQTVNKLKGNTLVLKTTQRSWHLYDGVINMGDVFKEQSGQHITEESALKTKMIEGEHGVLPEKFKPVFSAIVDVNELQLPVMDTITFEFNDGQFMATNKKEQNYSHKIQPRQIIESNSICFPVNENYFRNVIKQMTGDIYFAISESTLILAKNEKDNTQTYMIEKEVLQQ